jgi:hypothetical protein
MTAAILLRDDFDGSALRRLARQSRDAGQSRRLLSPSKDGAGRDLRRRLALGRGPDRRRGRADRARLGCPFQRQRFRWSFERQGGGRSKHSASQRQALRRIVEDGPIPTVHGVVRWRLIDLAQWVFEEFRVSISKQTLRRELRTMGTRQALGKAAPPRARRGSPRGF